MRSRRIHYLSVVCSLTAGLLVFYLAAAPGLAGQSLLTGGEHVYFEGDCCANDPSSPLKNPLGWAVFMLTWCIHFYRVWP